MTRGDRALIQRAWLAIVVLSVGIVGALLQGAYLPAGVGVLALVAAAMMIVWTRDRQDSAP